MRACITGGLALLLLGVGRVDAQQTPRLQVGTPVRAMLAAGGTLRYELNLPKRHFVAGRVDQDGVDATVTITGPAGRAVQRAARHYGRERGVGGSSSVRGISVSARNV